MRAVVLTGHGSMDKLEYHEDRPTPEPGPGDVVVKVADPTRTAERVILNPWLRGGDDWLNQSNASFFGSECNGGHADLTVIRAENARRVETDLSDAELATSPGALHTTEPLVGKTGLQPGETVIVTGASGGVGSMALQLCCLRGARVVAIASKAKEDLLLELGAEAVIDRQVPDLEPSSAYP